MPALRTRSLALFAAALAMSALHDRAAADPIAIVNEIRTAPINPAELAKRQQERRQQHEQTYRDSRELPGVYSMRDVCRLRLDGNQGHRPQWTATSLVASKSRNQQVRLKIQGFAGHAVLQSSSRSRFFGGKLTEFNLTLASFNDPKFVQVTTNVSVQYGSLAITRTSESPNGFETIALHQGHLLDEDFLGEAVSRTGVTLTISHHTEAGEPSNLQLTAADIPDLRRRHPWEIERHLRPLLRQVGVESILAADVVTARQIFAGELAPDPQVAEALAASLPDLDLPNRARRDAALAALREQGPALALAVAHLDRRGLSDQQNTLLDAAVSRYVPYPLSDVRRLRDNPDFLIDCLYSDDPAIRAAAHQRLQSHLQRTIPFELDAPPDRRAELIESLRPPYPSTPTTQPTTPPATRPSPSPSP